MKNTAAVYDSATEAFKGKGPQGRGMVLAPNARRVTCPMCTLGWVDVVIYTRAGQLHADVNEPRRCPNCKRNFKLEWLVQLVGVEIPGYTEPGGRIIPG